MKKVLFKEEQRFRQWWLWLILGSALLAIVIPLVNELSVQSWETSSSNSSRLILYGVLGVLVMITIMVIMLFVRLKTKITYDGIYVAYTPFVRKWKKISKDELTGYELRKYRANFEFGGHGMRKRGKMGQAFTISGDIGLQLYLKDGKKLLIGTQKRQAIKHAMERLFVDQAAFNKLKTSAVKENKIQLGSKTKKFLIIVLIELVLGIIIFSLIQIFK